MKNDQRNKPLTGLDEKYSPQIVPSYYSLFNLGTIQNLGKRVALWKQWNETGFLASQRLPTLDDLLAVIQAKFHRIARSIRGLTRDERWTASCKTVENNGVLFRIIIEDLTKQSNWFLRRVDSLFQF